MTKKRVLLTGAVGRVGRLVRPLLQAKYALRVCDLLPMAAGADDEEILHGDLADPDFACRAVAGTGAVVHLAGLVAPAVSFEDTLAPNYRAVLNLLEACRQGDVRRFVFASSRHIVGLHAPGVLAADAPVAPDGFYALSKVFGEAACALYARRFGVRTLIVRIGNADPEVVDGRRERLWVSARDLVQLLCIGIEHVPPACCLIRWRGRVDRKPKLQPECRCGRQTLRHASAKPSNRSDSASPVWIPNGGSCAPRAAGLTHAVKAARGAHGPPSD